MRRVGETGGVRRSRRVLPRHDLDRCEPQSAPQEITPIGQAHLFAKEMPEAINRQHRPRCRVLERYWPRTEVPVDSLQGRG